MRPRKDTWQIDGEESGCAEITRVGLSIDAQVQRRAALHAEGQRHSEAVKAEAKHLIPQHL